jgi:hypothetical protein
MERIARRQNEVMDFFNRTVIGYSDVKSCHLSSTSSGDRFSELWDFCVTGLYEPIEATSRITGERMNFTSMRELAEWASLKDFNGMSTSLV